MSQPTPWTSRAKEAVARERKRGCSGDSAIEGEAWSEPLALRIVSVCRLSAGCPSLRSHARLQCESSRCHPRLRSVRFGLASTKTRGSIIVLTVTVLLTLQGSQGRLLVSLEHPETCRAVRL